MPKPAPRPDNPAQSARFIKLAREIGAEGKPGDLERTLRQVATAKRAPPPKPKKRKR